MSSIFETSIGLLLVLNEIMPLENHSVDLLNHVDLWIDVLDYFAFHQRVTYHLRGLLIDFIFFLNASVKFFGLRQL